jgi:nucleotide-binding universal stress UspA family protein
MYSKILIPTDGSELAGKAVEHGVALAKVVGARITILTVTRPYRPEYRIVSRNSYGRPARRVPSARNDQGW